MTRIELNMNELFALEAEITGVMIQDQVVLKGLLQQDISYVHKFRLDDLLAKITPFKERLNKLRTELVQKFGELKEDGQMVIKEFLEGSDGTEPKINPDYVTATGEIKDLLDMEVPLDVHPFMEEDFQFKATEYYPVFNKLIRKAKEQVSGIAA